MTARNDGVLSKTLLDKDFSIILISVGFPALNVEPDNNEAATIEILGFSKDLGTTSFFEGEDSSNVVLADKLTFVSCDGDGL